MFRFKRFFEDDDERRVANRNIQERINFCTNNPTITMENFRMSPIHIEFVISRIGEKLKFDSIRNGCLCSLQQLLTVVNIRWEMEHSIYIYAYQCKNRLIFLKSYFIH